MSDFYRQFEKDEALHRKIIYCDETFDHRDRMTAEGLHDKGDIARELAYRDILLKESKADKREAVIQAFMAGQAREGIDPSYSDAKNYEAKLREGEDVKH